MHSLSLSPDTLAAVWPCLVWPFAERPPGLWFELWPLSQPALHVPPPQPAGSPGRLAEGTQGRETSCDGFE